MILNQTNKECTQWNQQSEKLQNRPRLEEKHHSAGTMGGWKLPPWQLTHEGQVAFEFWRSYTLIQNRIHGTGKSQLSAWCHYLAGLAQAWSLIAATRQSCFENLLVDFQELSSSVPAVLCKAHWQGLSKQDVVSAMSKLWNFISLPYEYNAGKHDPLQTSGHVADP